MHYLPQPARLSVSESRLNQLRAKRPDEAEAIDDLIERACAAYGIEPPAQWRSDRADITSGWKGHG